MKICAVDPGASGGIAFYRDSQTVSAVPMPQTNKEIWDYINNLKETYGGFILFIEKVQLWMSDMSEENRGKAFRIQKMVSDYKSMIALFEVSDIPVIEVTARTWQKELGFVESKKMDKTQRKNLYKRYAAKRYPSIKPTLKTSDALCILDFGRKMIATNPSWVVKNQTQKGQLKIM